MGALNFYPLKAALFIHVVSVKSRQTLPDNVVGTGFIPHFDDANLCRGSKQRDRIACCNVLSCCLLPELPNTPNLLGLDSTGQDGGRKSNDVGKLSFLDWSLFGCGTSREATTFSQIFLLSMVPVDIWPVYTCFALSERQRLNSPPNPPQSQLEIQHPRRLMCL